jgi:hypothetical protein
MPFSVQKPSHFSVSNTEFEGGDDGLGYGDCTFLVKQAQPSHCAGGLDCSSTPQVFCASPNGLDYSSFVLL